MASTVEPQKQLLSLIRDFAAEKSHGERRVSDLRKQLLDLRATSDAAGSALGEAKSAREAAERELRGSQVQLSMCEAAIVAQQSRVSLLQEEVSKLGSALAELKNEEGARRDEFISKMQEFNRKIRQFHEMMSRAFGKQSSARSSGETINSKKEMLSMEDILKAMENKFATINSQIHTLKVEYHGELYNHDKICQELATAEERLSLVEAVVEESKLLQELSGQTSELEKTCAALGEKLQRRYECPSCHINNMGDLEGAS